MMFMFRRRYNVDVNPILNKIINGLNSLLVVYALKFQSIFK